MENLDNYIQKLFNDPGFGIVLGIFSIWYSFFLFKKTPNTNRIAFLTMSNFQKKETRTTTIVLINQGNSDLLKSQFLRPITLTFKENLVVSNVEIKYDSYPKTDFKLIKKTSHIFVLEFDIFKKDQEIVLMSTHDSKLHMDDTWKDLDVDCLIVNSEILRDDFSDQMIYRARSVELEAGFGAALVAIIVTFTIQTFLKPFEIHLPYSYLFFGSLILSFLLVYNFFAARVGHREYLAFWKVLKKSRKN